MAVPPINVNITIGTPAGREFSQQRNYHREFSPQPEFPNGNNNNIQGARAGIGFGQGSNASARRSVMIREPTGEVKDYNIRLAQKLEEYGRGNPQENRYHYAASVIASYPKKLRTAAQARREITGVGEHISWAIDDILALPEFANEGGRSRSASMSESYGGGAQMGQAGGLGQAGFNQRGMGAGMNQGQGGMGQSDLGTSQGGQGGGRQRSGSNQSNQENQD